MINDKKLIYTHRKQTECRFSGNVDVSPKITVSCSGSNIALAAKPGCFHILVQKLLNNSFKCKKNYA